ncbi:High-affinity nitrate transporter 2.1 [Phlyctochytrium planicorne]|nr:High-affinity nitrate transporter 2.1 [Phlyctochytrium planicorne]
MTPYPEKQATSAGEPIMIKDKTMTIPPTAFPNDLTPSISDNEPPSSSSKLSIFTNQKLAFDPTGRATNIKLLSLARPHMLSFHISWLAFFTAFTGWFAYAPLLKKTVGPNLNMTESDISNSDIANVSATVVFRLLIGPLVDKLGSSRVMGIVLLVGSVPLALSTLSKDATGIVVSRLFIGVLGTAFVPCQYWTTALFSRNVVGTANAIAGGWGNMGAGVTYLLMPQVFNLFKNVAGLDVGKAWRVSMLVPVVLLWIVASLCFRFGDDKPHVTSSSAEDSTAADVESINTTPVAPSDVSAIPHDKPTHELGGNAVAAKVPVTTILLNCLSNPAVLILMFHYACCFGVELSVDSVIGNYFIKTFNLDQATGALFGGIFGLMNIFSRATGGLMSDVCAHRFGQRGRIAWQAALFFVSAVTLIGFSYSPTMSGSILALIIFSYTTEAGAGSTFGIVPFVSPFMGAASGLIGAGGNIGGALFNVLFRLYVDHPREAFRYMGVCIAIGGFLFSFLLVVEGDYLLKPLFNKTKRVPKNLEMEPGYMASELKKEDDDNVIVV